MGLFLAMSSVVGGGTDEVVSQIQAYTQDRHGCFESAGEEVSEDELSRLVESKAGTTVLYPSCFFEWDEVSAFLSERLSKPVFSFHIHDGDLWMFILFTGGNEVLKFNPIPDYWAELSDDEKSGWLPSAQDIATYVPHAKAERLAPYLREWPMDGAGGKANPEDEYGFIDWQVVDFMRELGFDFPEEANGQNYMMKVKQKR